MSTPNHGGFVDLIRYALPPWLRDRPATPTSPARTIGFRLAIALFSLPADAFTQVAIEALRARFPGAGTPTALPYIGSDRQIVRGLHESDDAYAARLRGWLDTWRFAGNLIVALEQLPPLFSPGAVPTLRAVTNQGVWYTWAPDGGTTWQDLANWNWDGLTADRWARSWIIVYSPGGYPWSKQRKIGVGKIGSNGGQFTIGTTATHDEAQTLRQVVQFFNGGHVLKPCVIVPLVAGTLQPGSPEPDGHWGKFYKLDGSGRAVRSRLASARYFTGAT